MEAINSKDILQGQGLPEISEILTFISGNERFGIRPTDLSEIVEEKEILAIPNAPEFLSGVINSHGRIISVMDLSKFAKGSGVEFDGPGRIAVLGDDEFALGILIPHAVEIIFYSREVPVVEEQAGYRFFRPCEIFGPDGEKVQINLLDSKKLYSFVGEFMKKWGVGGIFGKS